MRKLLLGVALLTSTITIAQNSLFSNVSTTDTYEKYVTVYDKDGDGIYEKISNFGKPSLVKFYTEYLSTGEGYKLKIVGQEGDNRDKVIHTSDAVEGDYLCSGYPYEAILVHKYSKDGYVSIGDYIFFISGISKDGTSFTSIDDAYIKVSKQKETSSKKKKLSFKDIANAVKDNYTGSETPENYGPAHQKLQSENLDKLITDYLVAMKAKQDARTSAELKGDEHLKAAQGQGAADLKAYNDSIKATPEYAKLKAHQARMKEMENGTNKQSVTIYNKTGKDIYIYQDGARNGTRINVNSSAKVDCSSNYTYKFDSNSGDSGSTCYSANTRCNSSITVK
jgi:hypothetical protein